MSPVATIVTQYKESFIDFLIKMSAIFGGIYTVTGIVDAVSYGLISSFIERQRAHIK